MKVSLPVYSFSALLFSKLLFFPSLTRTLPFLLVEKVKFLPLLYVHPSITHTVKRLGIFIGQKGNALPWQEEKGGHGVGSETIPGSQWPAATIVCVVPKPFESSKLSQRPWDPLSRQISQDGDISIFKYFSSQI